MKKITLAILTILIISGCSIKEPEPTTKTWNEMTEEEQIKDYLRRKREIEYKRFFDANMRKRYHRR